MSDKTLRSAVIKLAHANPELRAELLPLLSKTAGHPEFIDFKDVRKGMTVKVNGEAVTILKPVPAFDRKAPERKGYTLYTDKGELHFDPDESIILVKTAAAKPPGSGWQKTPGGHGGGMRREKKDGHGWDYWFPSAEHAAKAAEAHKKDSDENREKEGAHSTKNWEHSTAENRATGAAKHHSQQADIHGSQIKGHYAGHHAEAQQHHEKESEDHTQAAKKHKEKAAEHNIHRQTHKNLADVHEETAKGAAAFAAQKKPSLWEKTKALFSGKK